jgi:outer membrane lipoprotein-sorting protein
MGRITVAAAAVAVSMLSASALAQTGKPAPANPVGAGQGWSAQTVPEQKSGRAFEARELQAIQKVTTYFNELSNLKGQFVQLNPDGKKLRGRIYVKRPGRFRFDYAPPSKQVIISDGTYLAVQDLDIKTDDRYELDRTPFRLLLRKDVDLIRDANILDVQEVEDLIVLALRDKSPDAPGRIKLVIATKPKLELKEWITTDAQNLDTRVELSNIDVKEELDAKVFEIRSVALEKLQ